MVCSLTRAAAAEIASRARLPRENVSTLHAAAYRSLNRPPLAQDVKNVQDWNQRARREWQITGSSRAGSEDDLSFDTGKSQRGDLLLNEVGVLRAKLVETDAWPRELRNFWKEWEDWKWERQYLDFVDLIHRPVEYAAPPPGTTKAIVGDEAQDFTHLDIRLLQHWSKWCEIIVMAGDRNQALFTWTGADPKAFIPDDLPDSEITTLGQSYRVPEAVRAYATEWLGQDDDFRDFPYAARKEDGETVQGVLVRKPQFCTERPSALVEDIIAQLDRGHRVMVLASCKYMLKRLCSRLKTEGVPFHNPYRLKDGSWNPMRGGPERLAGFLRPFRPELEGDGPWSWKELKRWSEPIKAKKTFRHGVIGEIESRVKHSAADPTEDEVRMLLQEEAYEELLDAAQEEDPAALVNWYSDRLLSSANSSVKMAVNVARIGGVKKLVEEPGLVVGTLHSVKGGWADVVYLSPDLGSSAAKEWNNLKEPEGRNSIVRAFYVGMTRARKAVALMGASSKNRVRWI